MVSYMTIMVYFFKLLFFFIYFLNTFTTKALHFFNINYGTQTAIIKQLELPLAAAVTYIDTFVLVLVVVHTLMIQYICNHRVVQPHAALLNYFRHRADFAKFWWRDTRDLVSARGRLLYCFRFIEILMGLETLIEAWATFLFIDVGTVKAAIVIRAVRARRRLHLLVTWSYLTGKLGHNPLVLFGQVYQLRNNVWGASSCFFLTNWNLVRFQNIIIVQNQTFIAF